MLVSREEVKTVKKKINKKEITTVHFCYTACTNPFENSHKTYFSIPSFLSEDSGIGEIHEREEFLKRRRKTKTNVK